MKPKIVTVNDVKDIKGCILTYGHFNTIHPGHIRYLRHASSKRGQLVVALIGDSSGHRYPFSQGERCEALTMLGITDAILLLTGDEIEEIISEIRPLVLVLGNEYKDKPEIQRTLEKQKKQGGSIEFHAGDIHYATADLLSITESELTMKRKEQFKSACRRQELNKKNLLDAIEAWGGTRLIVLGDTIVDQYAACEAIGMSAEAPVVVVRELQQKNFIGGAAVVAAHINALGAHCDFISVVGIDDTADIVRNKLKILGIDDNLTQDISRPTTFKKRYVVENQKLFRVSKLEEHNLSSEVEDECIEKLRKLAPKAQGIVVSDFVYGVVTPKILNEVHQLAKKYNLLLLGDVQCSSQVGAITKFKNFSLLCPNEREARLALQEKDGGLEQLSQRLLHITGCEKLVMKLGSEGFIAYDSLGDGELNIQPFPALSVNPLDVAGAGDSLLALFATALASGQQMMPTAAIACCMTKIAVETMGNTPINATELKQGLRKVLES